MAKKNQSTRLTSQHKKSEGVIGIFGKEAKSHDIAVGKISERVKIELEETYPSLEFRCRYTILKKEINEALQEINKDLGQTLFLQNASIKPDGGIIEVKDDNDKWRIVLVTEAKHQGKDIENIKMGKSVGKNNDQELMAAGNAIERAHKNIFEIANFMLSESYFPYVIFLEGSNFLTQNIEVKRPDGTMITLNYNSGTLNRLDRLSAANYGMPFNKNLCKNKYITHKNKSIMLQAASIYTKGDGSKWEDSEMLKVMMEISKTSLRELATDIFKQITKGVKNEKK